MSNPFATPAMAEGYARSRPPLHEQIVKRAFALIGEQRVRNAVDIGCGAGLSTRPLAQYAENVLGVEPAEAMLIFARSAMPGIHFACARAEWLPLRSKSADLITAAGSLNYTDHHAALREIDRVMSPGGSLCVYDFSQGRTFRSNASLAEWFVRFTARYPPPVSEAIPLSPALLDEICSSLRVTAAEHFEIPLPMNLESYCDYMATETNVARAIASGEDEHAIRAWLRDTLAPVFGDDIHEVMFPGYIAWMSRPHPVAPC